MSETVYTYGHLHVAPYSFVNVTSLQIIKQVNEHAVLTISGVIEEDAQDSYIEQSEGTETIQVWVQNGNRSVVLFQGVVASLSVQTVRDVRTMTVEAHSFTVAMDMWPHTRTFQNGSMTYSQLFKRIAGHYSGSQVSVAVSGGQSLGGMRVQYKETDWRFLRRMASRLHVPLLPSSTRGGIAFTAGLAEGGEPQQMNAYHYTVNKQLQEYVSYSDNHEPGAKESAYVSYEAASYGLYDLGDPVLFHKRKLYVYRAEITMHDGVLSGLYTLRDKDGFVCSTEYPYALAGTSLFGTVLAVSKDKVKLHLDIDSEQSENEAVWLPYSTVYSSPDGSGWYCMPEVGDQVRMYFPDEHEHHAFAASSVDTEPSSPQHRSDPSVKTISNKYGKQIVFKPGAIEIIGNGQLLIRLTDDGGIEINSDKQIKLTAEEDIEIVGDKVMIQGNEQVELVQSSSNLVIQDEVTFSGAKVNIK
ncbi:phage baseplate assembly protein V [Paenibacillus xylaniclasticus]|uniref:phage baseplate assembly protein V n=1 Tax=Paenibacillus xylaniclasticus TaxID=588083 RepID=UPI000FDBCB32|nr:MULTISPECIES: phage baseplate assembly protein V [Paenibacillus]GFN32143.1 hypothetical protein PCURB6_24030 [Paenibacillus curdlanolyticus]